MYAHDLQRFSRFLLTLIAAFCIMLLVNYVLAHDANHLFNPRSMWFNRGYLLLVAVPVLILAWIDGQSYPSFGLSLQSWRPAAWEGFYITLCVLPVIFIAKMLLLNMHGESLLNWSNYFVAKPTVFAYTYTSSVILQQAIRSFLQVNLTDIFAASHPLLPMVVTSVLFAMMHLHFGLYAVLITFMAGLLFAGIYLRHQNIYGLIIPHTTLGIAAFMTGLL